MKHSFKKKLFVLIALLALFVGMLGVAPVLAATTFVDESPALPDGMSSGTLYNVWGSSAGDVYAVGDGNNLPLLYHNDGSGWAPESLTLPDGLTAGGMFGVWGSGAEDIYAVGWGRDINSNQGPLVYHKDSTNWTGTSLPLPNGWSWGGLYKIWGSSASDIYVVGFSNGPLAYHNDGNGWTAISPTSSGWLYDVWGSSASDVYIVGQGNDNSPRVYHNDGSGWTGTSLPLPAGWTEGYLFRIWGSSANDVYAVGSGYDSAENGHPLLYHNDGNGWTEATPALPDGWTYGSLRGIWGSSASDVYVAGYGASGKSNELPLLYHNDGNGWTEVELTVPDGWGSTYLQGVWGSSSSDVYLVGDGYSNFSTTPLIYHTGESQTIPPTVSTDSIETLQNRRVNATLSDLGIPASVSAYGVVYNTTGTPTISDSKVDKATQTPTTTGAYTVGLNEMNLTPGTKYYVRAFATNATDTSYGAELVVYGTPGDFTHIAPANNATDVSTSPTLSWNASTGATDYEYCVQELLEDCTTDFFGANWISTSGATSANITGLSSGTNYIWAVRAVVGTPASYRWVTDAPFDFTTAAVAPTYTVTFDANSGSGSMSDQSANSPTTLTTNTFTLDGYTFSGWNTASDGSGTAYDDGATYDFSANVTLYAQWIISSSTLVVKSTGANDGWVLESAEASNAGGLLNSTNTTFVLGDDGSDREYRAILDFDTSALPDNAVVSSVILKIKQSGSVVGTDPFSFASLYVDMRKPSFGNALLQLTDFNFTANKVKSAVFNPTPVNDWYGAHFNNGGNLYLNRTGATQLRLYFSTGDNNNSITDFIRFFSGEAASGSRPKLIITYTLP
jgi:uncharacterized repeat protein (TIGR02543 family)